MHKSAVPFALSSYFQIDGETSLAFSEDVLKRYEAYGWNTDRVEHGDTGVWVCVVAVVGGDGGGGD